MKLTWKDYLKEDAIEVHRIELPLNTDGIAEVVLNGDNHIGNPVYNQTIIPQKVIQSQIEYIEKHPYIRVIGMGDDMEMLSKRPKNHLRHSTRETLIREEAEIYCNFWENIFYQFIARVVGNHELRITRDLEEYGFSGIPIVDDKIIKESPRCILAEPERGLILQLKVGDIYYNGYVAHGTGNSSTPDYYLKRAFGIFENLDFVALAHIHLAYKRNFPILAVSRGKYPIRKFRWGIRTGTTVPWLAYSEKKLYTSNFPSNVIVKFRSDRKQIIVERLMERIL